MLESSAKDFKVAIVGGGMCGILCAIGLTRAGMQVDLFEAAPKFDEVGAGVGLGPNALRALEGLGVLNAVLQKTDERTPRQRTFLFRSGYGNHEVIYDYPQCTQNIGIGIYRPAFLEALMPLLDSGVAHFDKRCISISTTASGRHILLFADGTTHEADLIIGADGVKSMTRAAVIGDEGINPLVFSNSVAYRGLVSAEALEKAGVKSNLKQRPVCWIGHDRHIITFPIQGGRIINIVAFSTNSQIPPGSVEIAPPWVESVPEKELLAEYQGWGDDAMIILNHIKRPSKWSIHYLNPPLTSYVGRNIVLIGDAAHAMLPHLGAGVGQGFEDVFILCALLGNPKTKADSLEALLQLYDSIRRPRANMVLQRSHMAGEIYEGYRANGSTFHETQQRLVGLWEPVWRHDVADDINTMIRDGQVPKAYL